MTIDDLAIGQSGVISQVGGEGPLRLRFLDMGLIPGTKVTLQKIAPMGDPIQIQVRGRYDFRTGGKPELRQNHPV